MSTVQTHPGCAGPLEETCVVVIGLAPREETVYQAGERPANRDICPGETSNVY